MILVHRNPFEPMMAVYDAMHRRFHETAGQVRGNGAAAVAGTWAPPVELYETDDALVLQVELPGVSKDAVTVELHEHTLRLSGERTREPSVTGGPYQREEGHYGAFPRAFRMPTRVDEAKIQTTYRNGVLALRRPKQAAATPQGRPITGEPSHRPWGRSGVGSRPARPRRVWCGRVGRDLSDGRSREAVHTTIPRRGGLPPMTSTTGLAVSKTAPLVLVVESAEGPVCARSLTDLRGAGPRWSDDACTRLIEASQLLTCPPTPG